jgi:Lar family restriction alleviation protein
MLPIEQENTNGKEREMEKIKTACPFCGDLKRLYVGVSGNYFGPTYFVACATCSCCGPVGESRSEAIELWKNRKELDD